MGIVVEFIITFVFFLFTAFLVLKSQKLSGAKLAFCTVVYSTLISIIATFVIQIGKTIFYSIIPQTKSISEMNVEESNKDNLLSNVVDYTKLSSESTVVETNSNSRLEECKDISDQYSVVGKISYEGQVDKYSYTAQVSGTYRFDTDLSSGGGVIVEISGENGNSIKWGYDALTIDLESEKNYILSIEYRNGECDYKLNIGEPISITDITNNSSVVGSIKYKDQKDRYYYTAQVSGTYRFSTDLSSGGSAYVRISGQNGNSIKWGYDALTIDLESGKTYILSIEYRDGKCDYEIDIGVPISITDITNNSSVKGSIKYKDQKDRYYYTAQVSGTYIIDTNLSAGGSVYVRVSGENGNSINRGYDKLSIKLEEGKNYILSVEFRNVLCDYVMTITTP